MAKKRDIDPCVIRVRKALSENEEIKFSDKELDIFAKQLKNQNELMSAEMLGKEATRLGLERQREALLKKQGLVSQAQKVAEKLQYIADVWEDAPGFGLEAIIVGVNNARVGARESTGTHQRAYKSSMVKMWRHRRQPPKG